MSYFKHMVSYKHRDSVLGNGGGFTVVWWQFNWIAINTTKKRGGGNLSLSAQSQVKYCNDFLLYIFLVPGTLEKNFFWGPILKVIKETSATKCIPGRFPIMAFHVWAHRGDIQGEKRKLQNEPTANAKGISLGAPQDDGPGTHGSSRLASMSAQQQKILSLPILTHNALPFWVFF